MHGPAPGATVWRTWSFWRGTPPTWRRSWPCGSCGRCVARLVQRLRTEEEFPHEVGLFLSYPPEDVQGFIDHRAMDFKCAGLWKVYGDQQRAQALFDRFRRCTQRYCALWQTGLRLEQLAVAV